MRRFLTPFLICLALSAGVSALDEPTLTVYTWKGYFSPRAVQLFEMRNNCLVEFFHYDSNDTMLQTLGEGGGYDVITPAGMDSRHLWEQGLLLPLDHFLLPNLGNILAVSSSHTNDAQMEFSVPYTVTVTGVAYNRDTTPPELVGTWGIFGDPRLRGKVAMLNDIREPIGAALRYLGHSANSTDPGEIRSAARQIIEWKPNIAMFSVEDAREGLRKGELAAIQTYNGEFALLARTNPNLAFFVPDEGSTLNSDQFVIGADTEQPALAHAFIDFFLDPDIAVINMEDTSYYMPNGPAREIIREKSGRNPSFFTEEMRDKCEVVMNLGGAVRLYDDAWAEVLFSK